MRDQANQLAYHSCRLMHARALESRSAVTVHRSEFGPLGQQPMQGLSAKKNRSVPRRHQLCGGFREVWVGGGPPIDALIIIKLTAIKGVTPLRSRALTFSNLAPLVTNHSNISFVPYTAAECNTVHPVGRVALMSSRSNRHLFTKNSNPGLESLSLGW